MNISNNMRLALVAAMAALGLSCGSGGGPTTSVDTTPPTVTATDPANNTTNVATNSTVTATFSEAIDPATVTTATFTLSGSSGAVTGVASASGGTATFTPTAVLAHNTTYTATVTTGVKDTAGNALAAAQNWAFTTAPAPDTTPPTVVTTDPASDATNVATNSAVTATFSETIDPATVTTITFTLSGGSGVVAGLVNTNGASATFTPTDVLAYSTLYTATLTTGITDVAGNPLATANTWSFTTEADPTTFGAQISNVSIAGQGAAATLVAGSAFTLDLDFMLWNAISCPRCVTQIVIGIEGEAQECIYDNIAEEYPGDGGSASLNLTAPLSPGIYAIRYKHELQSSCAEALTNYDNDPPSGNVIGILTVEPIAVGGNIAAAER